MERVREPDSPIKIALQVPEVQINLELTCYYNVSKLALIFPSYLKIIVICCNRLPLVNTVSCLIVTCLLNAGQYELFGECLGLRTQD